MQTDILWSCEPHASMCFYMVMHMVTTQGKTKEEMDWCWYGHLAVRGHLPHCGQDIIEEHCSAYRLPTRGVSIVSISLGVLSLQSSKWSEKSRYTETRKTGKSGKRMVAVCVWRPLAMKSTTNQCREHVGYNSVAIFIHLAAVGSQTCEIPLARYWCI